LISLFYEVVSGTADLLGNGTKSKVKETIVHEGYDGLGNDVALIIVSGTAGGTHFCDDCFS
jgi:hypothetical protein